MGVAEGVVAGCGGVPLCGEGLGVGGLGCDFCNVVSLASWEEAVVQRAYRSCDLPRGPRVESRRLACKHGLEVRWHRRGF